MKEALKLALEALEDFADVIKYDNEQDDIGRKACCGVLSYHPHSESCKAKQAITAIKAALAQPAQEPDHGDELTIAYMSGVHRGKELAAQPAQGPDYAYPTIEEYEEITGFKVNDTFRMGWAMARTTNDLFKQMEKHT
jgi:hypothetical protein